MPTVEICVQGIRSALAAERGGANRVELCEYLDVGGVTPSSGTIAVACERLSIPVHVLIRPREGDFIYDADEFEIMRRDVVEAKRLGAAGVVTGALTRSGRVDREVLSELISLARPMSVTFHKAFDIVTDPEAEFDVLASLGVDLLLTSGGAPTAVEGLASLRTWASKSAGRPRILAGGRIRREDISRLLDAGLDQIHLGSAVGPPGDCDERKVRKIMSEVSGK